jgi:hypothetical protein
MKKALLLLTVFVVSILVFSQGSGPRPLPPHYATFIEPYQGSKLSIQVIDTNFIELSFIQYNQQTGEVNVRGNLETGLRKISQLIESTNEIEAAARVIRAELNTNGTVKSRANLTRAIRYYDSIKTKWGVIE